MTDTRAATPDADAASRLSVDGDAEALADTLHSLGAALSGLILVTCPMNLQTRLFALMTTRGAGVVFGD